MEVTRFATHSPYRGVWRRQIRAGLGAVGIKKGMPDYEESVEQFIRRNLGAEVFERLIEPFCSGVYAGDPSKLGMKVRITPRVGRHRGGNGEQQADAHTSMRGGVWAGWACRVHIAQPWGRRMEVSVCTDSW
jgi:protoporphyrinogen oxidase